MGLVGHPCHDKQLPFDNTTHHWSTIIKQQCPCTHVSMMARDVHTYDLNNHECSQVVEYATELSMHRRHFMEAANAA